MDIIDVVFRTTFFYFFILFAYRIMGKREVAQLGVIDLIISILIAELAAMSIENHKESIFLTIIPITILVIIEVSLAVISLKSKKMKLTLEGKPVLLICNGKINYKELVKQRYTLDDLLVSLRQKSIKSIDEVEYAILEANGKLSIFKYNFFKTKSSFPMPLILDGKIQIKTLEYIHKDINWINKQLFKNNLSIENIFYAFYKKNKIFVIKKSDLN